MIRSLVLLLGMGSTTMALATINEEGMPDTPTELSTYIVVMQQPGAASASASEATDRHPSGRLNVNGPATAAYVEQLKHQQRALVEQAETMLRRELPVRRQFQHAINGLTVRLTASEAAALAKLQQVQLVEPSILYQEDTDVGPGQIGAPGVWDGSSLGGLAATRGEGVVIGILDSGINHDHPSFQAVAEPGTANEFTHSNPLGSGNYLGYCADNPLSTDFVCNDKLIGAYEFVFDVIDATDPDIGEDPFPDDTRGHGSHVAGIAAGNPVNANFVEIDPLVSGVAPRANLIVYDICYLDIPESNGVCPSAASIAAIDQIVADGIVDVVNFSISGGRTPWSNAVSLAFLGAVDAGVFVAASAGNNGPDASSVNHHEPWVTTVAASTHGRYFADLTLDSGPLTGLPGVDGSGPDFIGVTSAEIRFYDANPIGCTDEGGIAADFYSDGGAGTMALISRGGCSFSEKVDNALDAGASAVIVFNNRDTVPFSMGSLDDTTIPGGMVSLVNGVGLRDQIIANRPAATTIDVTATVGAAVVESALADVITDFSSRGPNPENILKPDVAAPGDDILSAEGDGLGDSGAPEFGTRSGTSMAAPHVAGAAALLAAIHPDWSPSEIKSALMLTAATALRQDNDDGTIGPATVLDRGAGRIELGPAALTPLVLNELSTRYLQADPASGGDARTLNLASLADDACRESCQWSRTLKSAADQTVTFTTEFVADGELTGSITPSDFVLQPGQSIALQFEVDTTAATTRDLWKSAQFNISGDTGPALHMPVAVFALGPVAVVNPDQLSVTLEPSTTTPQLFSIANQGGASMAYQLNPEESVQLIVSDQERNSSSGISSRINTTSETDRIAADDFVLRSETTITSVLTDGRQSGDELEDTAESINLYIWADDNGKPASSPYVPQPEPVVLLTIPADDPNVSLDGEDIDIDLAGLDQTITLPPGTYWLSVQVVASASWVWNYAPPSDTDGADAVMSRSTFDPPEWLTLRERGINRSALMMLITGEVRCGADWLSEDIVAGDVDVDAEALITATFDSNGLVRGSYNATECIESDEALEPLKFLPINLTVNNSVPTAANDTLTLDEGAVASELGDGETSLIANDGDADSDPLTARLLTDPTNGSVIVNADGSFEYTHDGSETISDAFDYEVCDNAPEPGCASATVVVSVNALNDAPDALPDDVLVSEGGAATVLADGASSLLANDSDAEDDSLTLTTTPISAPLFGALTLNADGTFRYVHDGSQTATDQFDYEVCDSNLACSSANVSITIVGVNSAPQANSDALTVAIGGTITETDALTDSLLANDSDPDSDSLALTATPVVAPTAGTVVLNTDGTFSYTHDGSGVLTDTFEYQVCDDGQPSLCAEAEVTVTIEPGSLEIIFSDGFESL